MWLSTVLEVSGWRGTDNRVGRCMNSTQMWSLQEHRRDVDDVSRDGILQVGCGDGDFYSRSSVNLAKVSYRVGTRLHVSCPSLPFHSLDLFKAFLPPPGSGNAEQHAKHTGFMSGAMGGVHCFSGYGVRTRATRWMTTRISRECRWRGRGGIWSAAARLGRGRTCSGI